MKGNIVKTKGGERPLKLIKTITLEEDVTDVNLTFDKPLDEIVLFYEGLFADWTTGNKYFCARSDDGSWYMLYEDVPYASNASTRSFYAHSKETCIRLWETMAQDNFRNTLRGTADSTTNGRLNVSRRGAHLSRYVGDLNIFFVDREVKMAAGSTIEIWGREVDENL